MEHTRIVVDATRIEIRWIGTPQASAPVLVFLHEGLGSVSLWRDFPDRVAAATGLAALVYSRAGYGGSDPVAVPRPLDYMRREAQTHLPALLRHLGLERVILIGHSDGATIALLHATRAEAAGRVVAVAALAPHSFVEPGCVQAIAAVAASYRDGDLRARLARHHGDNVDCAFWGWNRAWTDPAFATFDIRAELAAIACPVLVIQGEDDEYATTAQVECVAQAVAGPVRTLLLPACGHSPHRDQEAAVLAALGDFIAPLRGAGGGA